MIVLFIPLIMVCLLGDISAYGYANVTQCSLFSSGTWVHDDSYPLYNAVDCPYISKVNYRPNGSPASAYEKWRWQPGGSTISRFNASDMLEMLRGKRFMFVGDSTSRSQFESMVCLLQAGIPGNKKSMVDGSSTSPVTRFKALDYNASVELFSAPFLVELETNEEKKKVLHLDSIENNGLYWKGADILVFESSHWWPDHPGSEQRWDVAMEGNKNYSKIDPMVAYRKALTTWKNWVSSNIDFQRTRLFFRSIMLRSMSRRHCRCRIGREPVQNAATYNPPLPLQVSVLEEFLKTLEFPLEFMNITRMTALRMDASPVYDKPARGDPGGGAGDPSEQDYSGDCNHLCLPGVPDEWNKLLYDFLTRQEGDCREPPSVP